MRSPGALAIAVEEFQRAGVLAVLIQEPPAGTPVRCGAYDIVRDLNARRPRAALLIAQGVPYKVGTAAEDHVTAEVRPPGWGRWIELTSLYLGRDKALEHVLGRVKGGPWSLVGGDLNAQSGSWCSRAPSRQHQNQYDRESWRRGAEIDRWADLENLRCVNVNVGRDTFRNTRWGSAIDGIFLGEGLAECCAKGADVMDLAVPSDHEALGLSLAPPGDGRGDRQNRRTAKGRRNPKRTNWEKFIEHIDKCNLGTEIRDAEELERRAGQLQRRLKDAVRLSTRRQTAGRPGSKNWWNEDLEKLRRTYQRKRGKARKNPEVPALAEAEVEARRALLKGIKQRKRDAARKAIEAMDEGAVKRWAKPRALQEWFDAEQAMDYFVGPATGDGDRGEDSANHHREEANHGPTFEMEMEPFRRLLAVTPNGRAPGDDECAYEHVRYAVENSSNFRGEIWEVMKASVQLGVFPRAFKPVRLVLIPKPSKGVDQGNGLAENPWKRWRPISLLRVLGKVLEKVILWHWRTHEVPDGVHGYVPGRSTVTGIKAMRDWIEGGPKRCRQGFTGMLLEDVTGAFDHCRWQNVEAAVNTRVGAQWTQLVKSFLQGRVVTLVSSSGEHATRLRTKGVSQGSGLSPRLFVLDSCGMVDEIKKAHQEDAGNPDAPQYDIKVVIYPDDLCVGVKSDSIDGLVYGITRARQAAKAWSEREGFSLAEAKEELWVGGGDLTRSLIGDRLPELRGKMKEEVKWLGLTMKSSPKGGICFRRQAERSLEEAGKALKRYTPLCRRQFGLSEAVLEGLWHRVIIPKACYGAELWGHQARYAWFAKKAESLRHAAGRLMWRALGSTPGILMARVMEWKRMDHAVVERFAKATLYKTGWRLEDKDAKWLSQYAGDVLRNRQPDREQVAPEGRVIEIDGGGSPTPEEGCVQYYTDGSRKECTKGRPRGGRIATCARVGCGVAEIGPQGELVWTGSHRLPDWCTVYQSESKGIERACIRAEIMLPKVREGKIRKMDICVDNISALRAAGGHTQLLGRTAASARAAVIRLSEKLEEAGGELRLKWVKSHVGHRHNAVADLLAADGAYRGNLLTAPVPWVHTRELIQRKYASRGDRDWARKSSDLRASWAGVNLGPRQRRVIKAAHLSPVDRRRLMEVISGHSVTRRHWCKIDRNLGPECRFCEAEMEDERHIIFECRRFALERIRLKRRLGWRSLPYHIGNFLSSPSRLRVLMGFLRRVWPALEGRDVAAAPAAATGDSVH